MARREYNIKMNLSLSGTSFSDETHASVGSGSFYIDHDFFFDDDTSGEVLIISDAAAGGGNLLIRDTDYTITGQDTYLSTETSKNVYSTITITNAAYQAVTLYFSGKYVADAVDKEDVGRVTFQYSAVNASATLAPTGYTTYGCTAGTNGIKLTLPTVSMAYENIKLEFIKLDNTDSAVTIAGTINGLTNIYLIERYQKITIICNGTDWTITSGTLIADTGWINTNQWLNRHLGTANCPYDTLGATPFQIGELVKEETSNNTGIVMSDSGANLVLWKVTGTGFFTNNKHIIGQISGADALVNTATTTKIIDYNFYHGFAENSYLLNMIGFYSSNKTEANASQIYPVLFYDGALNNGIMAKGVDTNNIEFQTGKEYVACMGNAGAVLTLINSDSYYRFVVKLII